MSVAQTPERLRCLDPRALRARLRLSQEHESAIESHSVPASLLNYLVERELLWEATRLLGYALPEREAVWWACMCVAHTAIPPISADEQQALLAAESWVRQPNEQARRKAAVAAARAGYNSAAAWSARAAHASRPDLPLHMRAGRRIEAAIVGAAKLGATGRETQRLSRFIASGRDIAAGGAGRLPPESGTLLENAQ